MFVTRLISGIVLLIIAFGAFTLGAPVLTVLLAVISLIGYRELTKVLGVSGAVKENGKVGISPQEWIGSSGILAYYGVLLASHLGVLPEEPFVWLMACLVFTLLAELFCYVIAFPKYSAEQTGFAAFAFLYAPVMLSFIDLTRQGPDGKLLVWMILICSWGCDTCAYAVGILIGKKKIFPVLSPKKSLEGCIGGVLGAAALGALYAGFVMERDLTEVGILAVVCAFGAVASMVGDLAASAIKRNKHIKDYGRLIPGHGGIMDRFDSVIVTAPMVYFLTALLLH